MSSPATGPLATYPGLRSSALSPAPKSISPAPAPAQGLPSWAITIIIILAIMGFLGMGYWIYKSGAVV